MELLEDRQLLSTITVNTTGDDTTADSTLSLREAIEVSNGTLAVSALSTQEQAQVNGAVGTTNTIDFNIPKTDPGYNATTGVWTIAPKSDLPTISTNAAVINGYSQPGASKNTLAQGDNAKLTIAISGTGTFTGHGLTIGQQGSQVSGLDVENFLKGIVITAAGNVHVTGSFIGTNPTGETAAPNGYGVEIDNSNNTIGGPQVGDRNVISGNNNPGGLEAGIIVSDPLEGNPLNVIPTGILVENNYVGIDATGTKAIGNGSGGVLDFGTGNTYGGTTAGLGNVISGNMGSGLLQNGTGSITIEGNYFGTDATGNVALANVGYGLFISGAQNAASSTTISDNVVSGNTGAGILLNPGSQSLDTFTISNNLVGTNAAGTAALGNGGDGLEMGSVENTTITNNVISANSQGISMVGFGPDNEHNVFQGNLIGTDKTGTVALGNKNYGIYLGDDIGTTIGGSGPGEGNVIAFNGAGGLSINGGKQDPFVQNSIFGNTGPGITLNQANNSVSPPTMTFTPSGGSNGTLSGTLNEKPNLKYIVEIYSNPSAPVHGLEQGKTFIQNVTVNTDGSGKGSFSVTEPNGIYTATATDPSGDTSAFSNAAGVAGTTVPAASVTAVTSSSNPSTTGQQVTFTAVVTVPGYQGTPTGSVTFTVDGHPEAPVPLSVSGGQDEALFVTSTLGPGQHTITAMYSGDAQVNSSTGSLPTQNVSAPGLVSTTTTLTSSLDPSIVGQEVTFTAVVTPGSASGSPSGIVAFTIDGIAQSPVSLVAGKSGETATFSIFTLTSGKHTILASYGGDSTFAGSAVAAPFVQTVNISVPNLPPGTDGPTVTSLQRFGIHMQPTTLVLTFNDGLDPTSASDLANYKIVGPDGRRVAIGSATFDAALNTVTLRTKTRINLHHTYELTVIGTGGHGLRDTQGLLLDGASNGQPGSNYTGSLTWRNVVWTPAEYKKYVHPQHVKPAGPMQHRFVSRSR